MPVPSDVKLKDPKQFRLIGKRVPRKDSRAKTNGTAQFTIDVKLPGMLTAVVAHPPLFGAKVKSFDAAKAKAVRGVVNVVQIPSGVAVLGTNFWSAKQGRDALSVQWDESGANKIGSAELMTQYKALAAKPGLAAHKSGDVDKALAGAAKTLEASFEFPYLAHSAMEPMNCVMQLKDGACEVWNGEQFQTVDQGNVAGVLGLKPAQVKLNMLYARRQLRPARESRNRITSSKRRTSSRRSTAPRRSSCSGRARTTRAPAITGRCITTRCAPDSTAPATSSRGSTASSASRYSPGTPFEPMMVKDGIDATSVEGASNLPYEIPNMLVDLHTTKGERAGAVVALRRFDAHRVLHGDVHRRARRCRRARIRSRFAGRCSAKHPRHRGVLDLAAAKAGLGQAVAERPRARHRRPRIVQHLRRASRRSDGARERRVPGSTASCARSIAAWRSIPT